MRQSLAVTNLNLPRVNSNTQLEFFEYIFVNDLVFSYGYTKVCW